MWKMGVKPPLVKHFSSLSLWMGMANGGLALGDGVESKARFIVLAPSILGQ